MKKPTILFIQGGGEGAYEEDKKLALNLQDALGRSYGITYPKMPNENDPDYEFYKIIIDEEPKKINGKVILVGQPFPSQISARRKG